MVDAVDECDSDQLKLLDFIADSRSKLRRQHRCLCTEKQVWMQYLAKNAWENHFSRGQKDSITSGWGLYKSEEGLGIDMDHDQDFMLWCKTLEMIQSWNHFREYAGSLIRPTTPIQNRRCCVHKFLNVNMSS